jgi:hypothetical protein
LHDFLAKFPTGPAFEHSDFELWSDFRCPGDCTPKFDEFAKIVTFESSDTEIVDIIISIIETALVVFFGIFLFFAL